jgi:hypothetical protein
MHTQHYWQALCLHAKLWLKIALSKQPLAAVLGLRLVLRLVRLLVVIPVQL